MISNLFSKEIILILSSTRVLKSINFLNSRLLSKFRQKFLRKNSCMLSITKTSLFCIPKFLKIFQRNTKLSMRNIWWQEKYMSSLRSENRLSQSNRKSSSLREYKISWVKYTCNSFKSRCASWTLSNLSWWSTVVWIWAQ